MQYIRHFFFFLSLSLLSYAIEPTTEPQNLKISSEQDGKAENPWLEWHSSNVHLLHGNSFELGEHDRRILGLEHAHGWKYGDNYFFLDAIHPEGEAHSYYGEFIPRLSLNKISGRDFSCGIIKDSYLAGTIEFGTHIKERWLGGLGVELDVPYFKYLKLEAYFRDNPERAGNTWQLTGVWNIPIEIANHKFTFEGFIDYAGHEGTSKNNLLASPRILYDLSELSDYTQAWECGLELLIWHNKFGIKGLDEHTPQIILMYRF